MRARRLAALTITTAFVLGAAPATAQDTTEPPAEPTASTPVCPGGDPLPVPAGPADVARASALSASLHEAHRFATGAGVTVAVIDTGVTPHPLLPELVDAGSFLEPPYSSSGALTDCEGHGTAVASIIGLRTPTDTGSDRERPVGVAPGVRIIAIKQSETKNGGTLDSLGHAIDRALDEHADVINLSVSSCLPNSATLAPGVLQEAVERAEREGTVIVAAAGNITADCPADSVSYPAHFPTVIAVSALNTPATVAEYSLGLSGKHPVGAPGSITVSASTGGQGYATATDKTEFRGTSFAAPVVTGFVALLKERHPRATPTELRAMVYSSAHPVTGALDVEGSVDKLQGAEPRARRADTVSPETPGKTAGWEPLTVLVAVAVAGLMGAATRRPARR